MALYTDLYALINDPVMITRVKYALYITARAILAAPTPTVQQKTWANKVFQGNLETPFPYIMALVVASPQVSTQGAAIDDATLQQVINGLTPTFIQGIVS